MRRATSHAIRQRSARPAARGALRRRASLFNQLFIFLPGDQVGNKEVVHETP